MKPILKYIILLILLTFTFSCNKRVKNQYFIDKLSSIQNGLPSPYFNYYLYFKMDNNKILETNINSIYKVYSDNYSNKYNDFDLFLENIFNGKEIIMSANVSTL